MNLYAYCGNSPVIHADSDGRGLISALIVSAIIIAVAATAVGVIFLATGGCFLDGFVIGALIGAVIVSALFTGGASLAAAKKKLGLGKTLLSLGKGVGKKILAERSSIISGAIVGGIFGGLDALIHGENVLRGIASGAIMGALGGYGVLTGAVGVFAVSVIGDIRDGGLSNVNLVQAFVSGLVAFGFGRAGARVARVMGGDALANVMTNAILGKHAFVVDQIIRALFR